MQVSLRERLDTDASLVGAWVTLSDPAVAEIAADLGYDLAFVDLEHGAIDLETVLGMARAVDAAEGSTASVVRLPSADPVAVKRVLDTGVDGVMAPMIDSREAAASFVRAARYPPAGERGVGVGRSARYGRRLDEAVAGDNDRVGTLVQIESEAGVENAREIAAVDGLDGLFVGPVDLSTALGVFGRHEHDRFRGAVERVLDAADAADTPVGTLATTPEDVERWASWGFDFVVVGVDVLQLLEAGREAKERYERTLDG